MRLTAQIGDYEMYQVILDLGFHANVLPKQTWERMGRHVLQWSLIQFRMVNQQKIIIMGQLYGVTVDIEGASTVSNFEVIEIFYDNNPYPALLGIDQDIDINGVINLKKRTMSFERNLFWVIVPLDPIKGACYTKPVRNYDESDNELDRIYKIIAWDQDQINLMENRWIAQDQESSCTFELEHWQNCLHEASTLQCNMMTKSLCCVSSKIRKLPFCDHN